MSIDPKILTELDKFCKQTGLNRSAALISSFNFYKPIVLNGLDLEHLSNKKMNQMERINDRLRQIETLINTKQRNLDRINHEIYSDLQQLPEYNPPENVIADVKQRLNDFGPLDSQTLAKLSMVDEAVLVILLSKQKDIRLNDDYDWELIR